MIAGLRVRPMILADIESLVALAETLPQAPHWPPAAYEAALQQGGLPQRIALVAEASGSLAGFVLALCVETQAELESIAVSQTSQRHGVARALLAGLYADLRRRDVTTLLLEVRNSNAAARALYLSEGFQEVGRRPHYYSLPPDDALLLNKTISNFAAP